MEFSILISKVFNLVLVKKFISNLKKNIIMDAKANESTGLKFPQRTLTGQ